MKLLDKFKLALRFIGWRQILHSVIYSAQRDVRNATRRVRPAPSSFPGQLLEMRHSASGAELSFEGGMRLEVCPWGKAGFRLTWTPGALPLTSVLYSEGNEQISVSDEGEMAMRITPQPGGSARFEYANLSLEISPAGAAALKTSDGIPLTSYAPPTLSGAVWQIEQHLQEEEHVCGLGQRAAARLNLRPGTYRLWNTSPGGSYSTGADPLYLNAPTCLHLNQSGSFLAFYENTHRGSVSFTGDNIACIRFEGGALRIYLTAGSPPDLIRQYTHLTGHPTLPPRWALGIHQSRWGYQSASDLREVIDGYEAAALPLDAIHQDIDYMDRYRVFTVDTSRYPNFRQLADEMAMRNVRLVTILDPGVAADPSFHLFQSGLENDHFLKTSPSSQKPTFAPVWPGWTAFPDFAQPTTRTWWGDQYQKLLNLGAAGIWHDMNEPEAFAAWGDPALPDATTHHFPNRPASHVEARNLYALLMNLAGFQALRRLQPDKRPWILSRSGWPGSQRYAWHWTADVESSWEALKLSIPMLLHLGLSGFPFSGTDIGGFSGNPEPELVTRWTQFAVFTPFFRFHAAKGTPAREPFRLPEPYRSFVKDCLTLRKQLMPYLYTLAREASQTGAPLMRPLFWRHPDHPELWDADDAFLLGDDILVAPVLTPNQRFRQFPLPPGTWHHFWSEFCLTDAPVCELPVTRQRIPVFLRGGSILPLEIDPNTLLCHICPDVKQRAEGTIYFDAGDGYGPSGTLTLQAYVEDSSCYVSKTVQGPASLPWSHIQFQLHGHDAEIFEQG